MILCNKFSLYQTQSVSRQPLQESFELILAHEKAETLLFVVSKQRWMWSFYKGSPDTINFHNVWHGNQSYLDKVKVGNLHCIISRMRAISVVLSFLHSLH